MYGTTFDDYGRIADCHTRTSGVVAEAIAAAVEASASEIGKN